MVVSILRNCTVDTWFSELPRTRDAPMQSDSVAAEPGLRRCVCGEVYGAKGGWYGKQTERHPMRTDL